jgi:hypothetical protein
MNQDSMEDFVKDMENDILEEDDLQDMIKEDDDIEKPLPPKPVAVQRKRVPEIRPMRRVEKFEPIPTPAPVQSSKFSLDQLKGMVSLDKLKLPVLVLVLYVVLSLPKVDELLGGYINMLKPDETGKVSYLALGIKGLFFGLVVLVMNKLFSL